MRVWEREHGDGVADCRFLQAESLTGLKTPELGLDMRPQGDPDFELHWLADPLSCLRRILSQQSGTVTQCQ